MIWKILSKSDNTSEQYHLASLSCGPPGGIDSSVFLVIFDRLF